MNAVSGDLLRYAQQVLTGTGHKLGLRAKRRFDAAILEFLLA